MSVTLVLLKIQKIMFVSREREKNTHRTLPKVGNQCEDVKASKHEVGGGKKRE